MTLDERAALVCRRAAAVLGLVFAAVDLEVEEDGAPWVIDVNPAPMFAGFESRTGLDVAGPLARVLVETARRGALPAGAEEGGACHTPR